MSVGVLALQGDFERHCEKLDELGAKPKLVKTPDELESVSGVVIPGGESTALLRLLKDEMKGALIQRLTWGLPCLATCAGVILLARQVENPEQESLGVLDITVSRNAYGRQLDSFIAPVNWTSAGEKLVESCKPMAKSSTQEPVEGVFIRAPKIVRVGPKVTILGSHDETPVLIQQDKILAATFHPELSQPPGNKPGRRSSKSRSKSGRALSAIHQLFLDSL